MADADVDGPLAGNTKVHLVDGSNDNIKTVYERFHNGEELYVWSNVNGNFTPAKVAYANKIKAKTYLRITLDDGTKIRMTPEHRQYIIKSNKLKEVRGKNLKVGDSIPCTYLIERWADGRRTIAGKYLQTTTQYQPSAEKIVEARGQVSVRDIYGNPLKPYKMLHKLAAEYFYPELYKKYKKNNKKYAVNKPARMKHIHHKDGYVQNNSKGNLEFLRMSDHRAHHAREFTKTFNGSKEHVEAIGISNSNPEHDLARRLGKMGRYYIALEDAFGKVTKDLWNKNIKRINQGAIPTYENLPIHIKKIQKIANRLRIAGVEARLYTAKEMSKKMDVSTTNRNEKWFRNTKRAIKKLGYKLNRVGLEALREINLKRGKKTLSWESFKSFSKLERKSREYSNHKIVKIEKINKRRDFYCLTVPESNNFYIHDKKGNALLTGNSHISVLLLTFLYKYTPSLIKEGRVFIIKSPVFLSRYKNKTYFGFTKDEIYEQAGTKNVDITYLKGLGECSDSDLRHFAMDPKTRNTFMVEWPGSNKELKDFEALMGKSSEYRKKLLNVD